MMAFRPSATGRPVTVGVIVRSVFQNVAFVVSLLLWTLLAQLTYPFSYRTRYRLITGWTHLNLWFLEVISGIRCEVRGLENIPAGGGIVMAKHQSTWETLALQRWFSPQTWVLKRELMRMPLFGWAMARLEPIAINRSARGEAVKQMVQEGSERLKDGRWVVVFPEGTRVAAGARQRYRIGGGVLAERTGATVIPVAHNAGELWGRNRLLKWPGCVQVRIGPPIDTQGKTAQEIIDSVEAWIESQMDEIESVRQAKKNS